MTRNNKGLLFKENIAYGFHRNMLAMKPVGLLVCLLSIVYALAQAGVLGVHAPYFTLEKLSDIDLAAGIELADSKNAERLALAC